MASQTGDDVLAREVHDIISPAGHGGGCELDGGSELKHDAFNQAHPPLHFLGGQRRRETYPHPSDAVALSVGPLKYVAPCQASPWPSLAHVRAV